MQLQMQIDGPQELNGAPPKPSRGKLGVRSAGCKRTRVGFRVPTLPAAKAREARRSGLNHPGKRSLCLRVDSITHFVSRKQGYGQVDSDSRHTIGAGSNFTDYQSSQVSQNQAQDTISYGRTRMMIPAPLSDNDETAVFVGMNISTGNGSQDFYTTELGQGGQGHGDGPTSGLSCQSIPLEEEFEKVTLSDIQKGLEFIEEEPYDCTCHNCFDLDHDGLDDYGTLGGQQSSTDNAKTTPLDMSSTTSTNCYLPYITPPVVHHSSYNAHAYGSMQPISDMMFLLPKEL